MPPPKRESLPGRGSTPKNDGRAPNGDRSKFRTDSAISNNRFGNERVLQPWVPDASDAIDGSLEKSSSSGGWDQFAENERLFGLKTDYDENMYTTVINKSHPQYRERKAIAEKKAQEIERSLAATAHVAEERVMDYVPNSQRGDEKENEEDKYSGVRRQDFPPLSDGRGNKYTPPAKRAPAAQSTVKGAPVDPAIISSQIKAPAKKPSTPPATDDKAKDGNLEVKATVGKAAASEAQKEAIAAVDKQGSDATTIVKPTDNGNTPKTSATPSRNLSPNKRDPATPSNPTPSATSTVEADVLKEFKHFASQQRINAEKVRSSKARQDKETKLADLKKFASAFKLTTPVPNDLVSIIAKDPAKQKEIQEKAIKNAEEMAKKAETAKDAGSPPKESQPKPAEQKPTGSSDSRTARAPTAPQNAGGQNGSRHQGTRQQYPQQQMYHGQQPYRNNRGGPQHPSMQHQQPGNLAQRLRHVEHQRYSQAPAAQPHASAPDVRVPPTGPANTADPNFNRRASAVPVHMSAAKALNPNTQEFQPRASAAPFNPSGISASSSPRSAVNNPSDLSVAAPQSPLIRRKTKAIDPKKCNILAHVKTFKPPQGRNWDDNAGLRPSYDTLPTWRQLQDDEKAESTMHLTYKEHFERQPFSAPSMNTPNPQHAMPQIPHQHQLPFHLQQGAHNMGMRQSPHMGHMQVHSNQHGPGQHPPFGNDDHHRMIPSSSSQSFASPRISQAPMAYNGMGSPAHVPYNQPVFMPPGAPQMGYRSFSNNQQYMSPQQGHQPMMMQPQFMHAPQAMVGGPQMMYPGGPPQFMPPAGPHQAMPGANGYASPGRPQAPMMAHQGSQQGQAMYGMSPNVQYNQPVYGPGQGGGPSRGHHNDYQLQHGYQHSFQHDTTQKRSGNTNGHHKGYSNPAPGQRSGSKTANNTSPTANASATAQG